MDIEATFFNEVFPSEIMDYFAITDPQGTNGTK